MFGSHVRLKTLSHLCRALSTLLQSGVGVVKAFDVASRKVRDARCRAVLGDVSQSLQSGNDVSSALREHGDYFPTLMLDMVEVSEHSGSLPEVLAHLAEHYEKNLQLRKTFLGSIAWPVFQFVAAVLVIALLILVLGWIADTRGGEPLDVLGFGLHGPGGAAVWLTCTFGSVLILFVLYQVLAKSLTGKRFLDPLLMRIPVLGHCMRSFAIARFSWAFYLTQQTGMPVDQSLQASLRATTNGAFQAAAPEICQRVRAGDDLTTALSASRLFPEDYLHMVHVAETSGTVPEALHRLGPQFESEARRSLTALTTALGWLVWLLVAAFIIFFIFRFVFWYIGMITDLAQEPF